MSDVSPRSFSDKLSDLTAELRLLDQDLKSNPSLNRNELREFRQTLDSVRMTAWTVQELFNARQTQKDPQAVISFLTGERLRRFSQMVRDLCNDLDSNSAWPARDLSDLQAALSALRERLDRLHGPI
jgi:hypothetical protein